MSEATTNIDTEVPQIQEPSQTPSKKTLHPGAKRNLMIIGGAVGVAAVATAAMVVTSTRPAVQEANLPKTTVEQSFDTASRTPSGNLTEEERNRLDRVTAQKADEAAKRGTTYIPSEVPMVPQPNETDVRPAAPGMNYTPGATYAAGGGSAVDQERMQRVMQGFQVQLGRIAQINAAPSTTRAERYASDSVAEAKPMATASANPGSNTTVAAQTSQAQHTAAPVDVVVGALHLAAAELASPIDTDKTSFASAKIASGPLQGATVYGVTQMVADQGVRIKFNRMLWSGKSFAINAIALDPSVSHDTISAQVDRKIFERYVLPLVGATASAYFQAIGQAGQQIIVGPGDVPVVVQPELKAKEAAAQGLAAGVAQAMNEYSRNQSVPSAKLPEGTPIGILFLDSVTYGAATNNTQSTTMATAPGPVANWQPQAVTQAQTSGANR